MAAYKVWTSNDPREWTLCHLETEDREEAKEKAARLLESRRFRFVALDHYDRTIWTNDPDTTEEPD